MRILIVDDSPDALALLRARLEKAGAYEVIVQTSIAAAMQRLRNPLMPRESDLDLILLDVDLNGASGIDACRTLRSEPALEDVPIIMVTAKVDVESLGQAFAAGAMDYMTKPVREIELLARVRSALVLKRETDARKAKEQELRQTTLELQRALQEIQVLRGLIKICSVCKKIQNDEGEWQQLESYIRERSEAEFTHGICESCARDQYPDLRAGLDAAGS
jgi:DNA-binding response OmpR family regulator